MVFKQFKASVTASLSSSLILGASVLAITACGGAPGSAGTAGNNVSGFQDDVTSTDPNHLILAMKIVSFKNGADTSITSDQAKATVHVMNQLYAQCNLHFRIEEYTEADPDQLGLANHLSSMTELDAIRSKFDDPGKIVVIDTASWNHGTMGPANAWTQMPGGSPSGAVLEGPVAQTGNLVAHEVGHYLGLDHVSDQSNMMNPIIYPNSNTIDAGQCDTVRQVAQSARAEALRHA